MRRRGSGVLLTRLLVEGFGMRGASTMPGMNRSSFDGDTEAERDGDCAADSERLRGLS
jgi:hypothetical protein